MTPEDDRLIASLVSPLVARTEALVHQVEALAADIVTLEGELRRRLSDCRSKKTIKVRLGIGVRLKGGGR